MKKYALCINNANEITDVSVGFEKVSEENIWNDPVNYQDKHKTTLFYQNINDGKNVYSVTEFAKNNNKIKEFRSKEYLDALIESDKNIARMKKTIYKRGDLEFVVAYEHPLLKNPLFFYFIKGENSSYLYSNFTQFFNLSVELTNFQSFSEKAILMLNEEDYGMNKKDLIRDTLNAMSFNVTEDQLKFIDNFIYEADIFKEKLYGSQEMYGKMLSKDEYKELSKKFGFDLNFELFEIIETVSQELNLNNESLEVYLSKLFQFTFNKINKAFCLKYEIED